MTDMLALTSETANLEIAVCAGCKHWRSHAPQTCAAFPDEIPDEILIFGNPHTDPFPGDHGIRFEAREPAAAK